MIFILLFFIIYQFYLFNENKKILQSSIVYNEAKKNKSQLDFLESMTELINENNFYSLLASLEIINNKIENNEFNDAYADYLKLVKRTDVNNVYKSLLSLHGSYNLLNNIENNKILKLLDFIDVSIQSFTGYHLEILYLISILDKNIKESNNLFEKIIDNINISESIKERVKKIHEFETYK